MKEQERYKIGTLIDDKGKIGVIYRIIEAGTLDTMSAIIDWRLNYEIYYLDGNITIMGHNTISRLIDSGVLRFLNSEEYDAFLKR